MKKALTIIETLFLMSIIFVVFGSNTASASEKNTVQTFESEGLIQLKSDKDEEVTVPANVTILSAETDQGVTEYTQIIDFNTQDAQPKNEKDINKLAFVDNYLFKSVQASTGGSKYVYGWDSTGGVKGNITVVYSVDNYGKYKITSVSGGYAVYDSITQVLSQSVIVGCSGGGITQRRTFYPTSSSWTLYPEFTNYVNPNLYSIGGANNTLSLKRNSSQWTMTVQNTLFQSGGMVLK